METLLNPKKEQKELNVGQDPFVHLGKGSTFSDRLKELIGNKSGRAFAKEAGISYSTLHNYLTNTSLPTLDNLITLANYANVSVQWLATGEVIIPEATNKTDINLLASHDDTFVEIDDCRDVIVTAGYGVVNDNYLETNKTKIERDWLRARGLKAEDCAKYRVCGDSMDDTLKDGEDIIVHHASKTLIDGKIFVLNNQGSVLIKRVQRTFCGVELLSDNSAYRPIKLTAEEADSLLVIGQVVLGYRNF